MSMLPRQAARRGWSDPRRSHPTSPAAAASVAPVIAALVSSLLVPVASAGQLANRLGAEVERILDEQRRSSPSPVSPGWWSPRSRSRSSTPPATGTSSASYRSRPTPSSPPAPDPLGEATTVVTSVELPADPLPLVAFGPQG